MGETKKRTVGAFLLTRLEEWGIRRVFGYPGDAINGILKAFSARGNAHQQRKVLRPSFAHC